MVGVGSALIGHLVFVMGRIYTIDVTMLIYILVTIVCSIVNRLNFYIVFFYVVLVTFQLEFLL